MPVVYLSIPRFIYFEVVLRGRRLRKTSDMISRVRLTLISFAKVISESLRKHVAIFCVVLAKVILQSERCWIPARICAWAMWKHSRTSKPTR